MYFKLYAYIFPYGKENILLSINVILRGRIWKFNRFKGILLSKDPFQI